MSKQIWIECQYCDDGMSGHDCGEDSCCCEFPEDNVRCDACGGNGGFYREVPDDFPAFLTGDDDTEPEVVHVFNTLADAKAALALAADATKERR